MISAFVTVDAQVHNLRIRIKLLPEFENIIKYEDINIQSKGKYTRIGNLIVFDTLSEDSYFVRFGVKVMIDQNEQSFVSFIPIKFSDKKDLNLTITFPEDCPYNRSSASRVCPKCKDKKHVVPIRYGLPVYDSLGNVPWKYEHELRGCLVPECPPHWYCRRHKLDF